MHSLEHNLVKALARDTAMLAQSDAITNPGVLALLTTAVIALSAACSLMSTDENTDSQSKGQDND